MKTLGWILIIAACLIAILFAMAIIMTGKIPDL